MKLVSRHIPKEFEDGQVSLLPEDPEDMVRCIIRPAAISGSIMTALRPMLSQHGV